MEFVSSCSLADLPPGTMKGVEAGGHKILLANVAGTLYAMQRKCPHMGFDLSKGTLDGATVTCRMHKATFDLKTGAALEKAKLLFLKTQPKPATTYPVKIEADRILVGV